MPAIGKEVGNNIRVRLLTLLLLDEWLAANRSDQKYHQIYGPERT